MFVFQKHVSVTKECSKRLLKSNDKVMVFSGGGFFFAFGTAEFGIKRPTPMHTKL